MHFIRQKWLKTLMDIAHARSKSVQRGAAKGASENIQSTSARSMPAR
jgi:hypothetical protein